MERGSSLSPLIIKYESVLEKDPRSRVFAPLAEGYRKLGLPEKALEILQKGIRFNPDYVMGYLGLASCYFDMEQFQMAYSTLRPLVGMNRDNIKLQRLFGDVCIKVDQKEEALDTFKYLLFLNPKDPQAIDMVNTLEKEVKEVLIEYVENDEPIKFDIDNIDSNPVNEDDQINQWIQVDLTKSDSNEQTAQTDSSNTHEWTLATPDDDVYTDEESDVYEDEGVEEVHEVDEVDATPVMTHTLVDLYVKQGHFQKAMDVLEKIDELQPGNETTLAKIQEVRVLMGETADEEESETPQPNESEGREDLMNLFDRQIGEVDPSDSTDSGELGDRLWAWHEALCQRAKERQIES